MPGQNETRELLNEIASLKLKIQELEKAKKRYRVIEKALRVSEAKCRTLTERMNDILWTCDLELKTTYVSSSLERVLGFTAEERMRQSIHEQITPETLEIAAEALHEEILHDHLRNPERQMLLECDYYHKDGSVKCLENAMFFIRDDAGNPIGIQGLSRDITERKRAEKELQERKEIFGLVFDSSIDGILVTAPTGEIIAANRSAREILGRTLEEILAARRGGLVVNDERLHEALAQRASAGKWHGELTLIRKDGTTFPAEVSSSIFKTPDNLVRACMIFRDITDRKKIEETLQESQKKYYQLFELESDAMVLLDRGTYKIVGVNKAAAELYGYSREELLSMSPSDLSAEPDKTRLAIKKGINNVPIRWHKKKNGTVFPVEIASANFILGDRPVQLGAIRDITIRMKMEQELRENEIKYRLLFEAASDPMFLVDKKTNKLLDVNPKAIAIYGYDRDAFLNMNYWEISTDPEATRKDIKNEVKHIPLRWHKRKDGAVFPAEVNMAHFKLFGTPAMLGSARDITERIRSEEELARHRDRLEELVAERTKELESKTEKLQEFNVALKILLQQRDADRKEMEDRYIVNIKNLILPYLEKIKGTRLEEMQASYVEIMESHFNEILSPLLKDLHHFKLTPTEAQMASLIKDGKSTKEIAKIMMVATGTVDSHRKNIRKKLGITKSKENLNRKLRTIAE